jgi:hypothetical protein
VVQMSKVVMMGVVVLATLGGKAKLTGLLLYKFYIRFNGVGVNCNQ